MSTQPVPVSAALPPLRTKFQDDSGAGGVAWPWIKWFQLVETSRRTISSFLTGTNTDRSTTPANASPNGSLFYVSDRNVWYVSNAGNWQYLTGVMQIDQADIPADLGANDKGFLVNVTDFQHSLYWDGTGWNWGPGESGSGYVVVFPSAPVPGIGWQLCDGSNVAQLQSDGTLIAVTVPVTPGSYFRQ